MLALGVRILTPAIHVLVVVRCVVFVSCFFVVHYILPCTALLSLFSPSPFSVVARNLTDLCGFYLLLATMAMPYCPH